MGSDTVLWRQPSRSAAAVKPGSEGFRKKSVPRDPSDPAVVTFPPFFDTHQRLAYLILESVGPR
jgi:hypothetical protein